MLGKIIKFFIGDRKDRNFKKLMPIIDQINQYDEEYTTLSDDELRGKTLEFRKRLEEGETVDDILPEAFAVVKQACRRLCGQSWEAAGSMVTWEMVPFDVQMAGGIELHRGNIAEMATGEGKTLVGVMPLYLNALPGKGAHLITVNDYLARRDSEWMGRVFQFLGLTVGNILTDMTPAQRHVSYRCDITYGTNNEFGFDYLRDNMAHSAEDLVQRGYHYAIVDEVDSVLIDEARTPLIISGQVDRTMHEYEELRPTVAELVRAQNFLINRIVGEAEEAIAKSDAGGKDKDDLLYEAGVKLLQARRGAPKHKRLTKVMGDARFQRLVDRVETDYLRDKRMPELEEEMFFIVDERGHTIDTTAKGREALAPEDPDLFLVPDIVEMMSEIEGRRDIDAAEREKLRDAARAECDRKSEVIHVLSQLLRAYVLYEKDEEYVVQDNKVIIVDEFTGRLMAGRRWSDGLHQAVEAKEGVKLEKETQTLATITLQNYFRMYAKLAGMTGTAETEASEFGHTYKMDVAVIPTNRPTHRIDDNDLIYKTQREKFNALIEQVKEVHASGMPILIGTVSVDMSEKISRMLRRVNISHSVLNAKHHSREAEIVREAGQLGAVTIATNMAGRGTDIKLGAGVIRCKDETREGPVCAACPRRAEAGRTIDETMPVCGLHILGTERHESRRIDRQLRGRAGRQGDPGYSLFFLSLEDDLMRLFASDRMAGLMAKGFEEGEAMSHGIATRAITTAQKRIEEMNFERRKRTLEYDNVMNKQREAIYGFRRQILVGEGAITEQVMEAARAAIADGLDDFTVDGEAGTPRHDIAAYLDWVRRNVPLFKSEGLEEQFGEEDVEDFFDLVSDRIGESYAEKAKVFGEGMCGALSRFVMLHIIDSHWRDHLLAIDELREGIHLRSYGQVDPLTEYQREATFLFQDMMTQIHKECFEHVFRATLVQSQAQDEPTQVSFVKDEAPNAISQPAPPEPTATPDAGEGDGDGGDGARPKPPKVETYRRMESKVGRNDPCPCGSGKKYKKCCGAPGAGQPAAGTKA